MRPARLRKEALDLRDPLLFFRTTVEVAIAANARVTEGRKYPSVARTWRKHTLNDLATVVRTLRKADDMRLFLKGYEAYVKEESKGKVDAERIARTNLGWCFGEGVEEDQWKAWNRATGIRHPFFGLKRPTPEEAYTLGRKHAEDAARWQTRTDHVER